MSEPQLDRQVRRRRQISAQASNSSVSRVMRERSYRSRSRGMSEISSPRMNVTAEDIADSTKGNTSVTAPGSMPVPCRLTPPCAGLIHALDVLRRRVEPADRRDVLPRTHYRRDLLAAGHQRRVHHSIRLDRQDRLGVVGRHYADRLSP